MSSPAGEGETQSKGRALQSDKRQTKAIANNKTHLRKARVRERVRAKANNRRASLAHERAKARTKTRKVPQMGSPTKGTMCIMRRSLSNQCARHIRCFEELVAEAGISCMYSCHQWHHVEKEICFGNLELRLVCKMNSHQAPRIPWSIVWLVHTTQSTGSVAESYRSWTIFLMPSETTTN